MEELISVIVPVYNVKQYLERCVHSLRNQTYRNLEIILVDDGSPDECPQMCNSYAKSDSRIKAFHKTNGGLSDARNYGTDQATGEYIIYVDSDDWLHQQAIELMFNTIRKNHADIVVGNFFQTDTDAEDRQFVLNDNSEICLGSREAQLHLYDNDAFITAWGMLIKSDIAKAVKYPVGKLHEDEFTTYKYYAKAKKIVWLDLPLYYYFSRSDSIMTQTFSVKRLDCLQALRERLEYFDGKNDTELVKLSVQRYVKLSLWMLDQIKNQEAHSLYKAELKRLRSIVYRYRTIADLNMQEYGYLYKFIDNSLVYYIKKICCRLKFDV